MRNLDVSMEREAESIWYFLNKLPKVVTGLQVGKCL